MKILSNQKVFITGAASGIGRSTAIAMGKLGCRLFLTDIDESGLKKTVDIISNSGGTVCLARSFDVGNYEAMSAFAKDVHEGYGPLDILVNVAGVVSEHPIACELSRLHPLLRRLVVRRLFRHRSIASH